MGSKRSYPSSISQDHGTPIVFTFTKDSIYNSILSSDNIIFELSTPNKYTNRITTIHRIDKAANQRKVVAEVAWKLVANQTQVKLGTGEWRGVEDWLVDTKPGWSTSRSFIATNGVRYRWKLRGGHLRLVEHRDQPDPRDAELASLAQFHSSKRNLFFKETRPAYFEVSPILLHSIDYVLVSFFIMECRRMRGELGVHVGD